MQIQVNTDNQIQGSEGLESSVEGMITQHLERFFPHLTRIEVHLSDANAAKGGAVDKQCAIEARIRNDQPIGVTHDDETMEKAIHGACDKMRSRLDSVIEQRRDHQA